MCGCQAIWRIDVENFPAIMGIDDKGHDLSKSRIWTSLRRLI